MKPAIRSFWTAAATLAAFLPSACDRSPLDGSDLDLVALEVLGGETEAGRSVVSDLITVAAELQSEEAPVPDVALPTLANLFDGALAIEAEEQGAEAVVEIRAGHAALVDSAWLEIDRGKSENGDDLLAEARALQAATAARVLGTQTSIAYVFLIGRTLDRVNEGLVVLSRQGVEVRRFARMSSSARDLTADARSALGRGRPAEALDIGGHAADLVNSLIREIHSR